jgi:predicted metal-dependent phosphoesterase TrpH
MTPLREDLHTHSTCSDGTLSPEQLVARALAEELDVLAITDHDTLAGVSPARQAAAGSNLQIVSGVEVSVSWGGISVHVLGLGIGESAADLEQILLANRSHRIERAKRMGDQLAAAGLSDAYARAESISTNGLITRAHYARLLVEEGMAKSSQQAFKRWLKRGKKGYVPGSWAELSETVVAIRDAGGVAIIAHPKRYPLSATKLRKLLEEFAELGGSGIEAVSGGSPTDEIRDLCQLAQRYRFGVTRGSDFHTPDTPYRELGRLGALYGDVASVLDELVQPMPGATAA